MMASSTHLGLDEDTLFSVIISTYNRREALRLTLMALGQQTWPAHRYEVVVVDNGCTDGTSAVCQQVSLPCPVRLVRCEQNRGASGGRNLGAKHACGRYLLFLSDDLIVPPTFLQSHFESLEKWPGWWVVGGFQQLPSLTNTPFGRYLDRLEGEFEHARKAATLGPNLWEMGYPTARNLSLPRADFEQLGGFDEQFQISCEDQDLADRARLLGVRFLYNAAITCLHNDQVGNLRRYCDFQRRGMHDTVRFCTKYPNTHGRCPVARLNGYVDRTDTPSVVIRKLVKAVLSRTTVLRLLLGFVVTAERIGCSDARLAQLYRFLIGLYLFRGYREGLRSQASKDAPAGQNEHAEVGKQGSGAPLLR